MGNGLRLIRMKLKPQLPPKPANFTAVVLLSISMFLAKVGKNNKSSYNNEL